MRARLHAHPHAMAPKTQSTAFEFPSNPSKNQSMTTTTTTAAVENAHPEIADKRLLYMIIPSSSSLNPDHHPS